MDLRKKTQNRKRMERRKHKKIILAKQRDSYFENLTYVLTPTAVKKPSDFRVEDEFENDVTPKPMRSRNFRSVRNTVNYDRFIRVLAKLGENARGASVIQRQGSTDLGKLASAASRLIRPTASNINANKSMSISTKVGFNIPSETVINQSKLILRLAETDGSDMRDIYNVEVDKSSLALIHPSDTRLLPPGPSMFQLGPGAAKPSEASDTFVVTMRETDTIELLYLVCRITDNGTPEAKAIEADKARIATYKNREPKDRYIQTRVPVVASQFTSYPRNDRLNKLIQLYASEIGETYKKEKEKEREPAKPQDRIGRQKGIRAETFYGGRDKYCLKRDNSTPEALRSREFEKTSMLLMRLLHNKTNFHLHKLMNGAFKPDVAAPYINFTYQLQHLFNMSYHRLYGKAVTSLSTCPINDGIVLATYGKYRFRDKRSGAVALWTLKNAEFPERLYQFKSPVNFAEFSRQHPHMIGVAYYSGYIDLIDTSVKNLTVICTSEGQKIHGFEPVWQIRWFKYEDEEVPITCAQNGRLHVFRKDTTFSPTTVFCVAHRKGKMKGVPALKRCHPNPMPVSKRPGAMCVVPLPSDPVHYLVGTDDGCVHTCSLHFMHQHLDVFAAHDGPVYHIEFHPSCEHVFLTCGGDFYVRVWVDVLVEPVASLRSIRRPVESAAWSSVCPDIIVSVSWDTIFVWDIRRKLLKPVSKEVSPMGARLTRVCFSNSGHDVIVGDIEGNIMVYTLTGMPFTPLDKLAALADTLRRILSAQPEELDVLSKLGPPF